MRFSRKSASITVGDRALADLQVRAATDRRATAAESRDWLLVKSLMQPGERSRARVAVRFPNEGNAAGHAFVTDQRLLFAFHERVIAVNLAYVVFAGRPSEPSLGDFVVEAQMPDGNAASRFPTAMRVRDRKAFHDFFPTLLDAVRATGAHPRVDANWGGEEQAPAPAAAQSRPDALPPEVVDTALAKFMEDGERIVLAAEMVHDVGGWPVTVIVTQQRLVVVDGHLIWATPLGSTRPIAGDRTHLRVLAEVVSDSVVLSGGLSTVKPGARRLALRSPDDPQACHRLHMHLLEHGGGVLTDWPS